MKLKKRYLFLIFIALLPFYLFIHLDDYCFGVIEYIIITGLAILFIIVFIVITFYNLYKINIKNDLFNYKPLLIAFLYIIFLFLGIKYHDKNIFKNEFLSFTQNAKIKNYNKIILLDDNTFELKEVSKETICTKKGIYILKNDTLILNFNNKKTELIYYFNAKEKILSPKNESFLSYKLDKKHH